MRLYELFENYNDDSSENRKIYIKIAKMLWKDCLPWIQNTGYDFNSIVYRGTNDIPEHGLYPGIGFYQMNVRKDRRPRDSKPELHNYFNQAIAKKGCSANRTNSVFVTASYAMADQYGDACVVFPIGTFNFTWNTKYSDALVAIDNIGNKLFLKPPQSLIDKFKSAAQEEILRKKVALSVFNERRKYIEKFAEELEKTDTKIQQEVTNYINAAVRDGYVPNPEEYRQRLAYATAYQTIDNVPKYQAKIRQFEENEKNKIAKDEIFYKQVEEKAIDFAEKDQKERQAYNIRELNKTIGKYFTNVDLEGAIRSGNEIMIECDKYYLIDPDTYRYKIQPILKLIKTKLLGNPNENN